MTMTATLEVGTDRQMPPAHNYHGGIEDLSRESPERSGSIQHRPIVPTTGGAANAGGLRGRADRATYTRSITTGNSHSPMINCQVGEDMLAVPRADAGGSLTSETLKRLTPHAFS